MHMTPLDYGRSFLRGRKPYNEVRFWVESRTRLIDEERGTVEDYIQGGSCKSEKTFVERDLFQDDNYDFLPVFGPRYGVIFRRKAWLNPDYKSVVPAEDMWGGQVYHLVECREADELMTPESVISASHAFRPIVSQTELRDAATGLCAVIECPVKTLNINAEKNMYQVDTGPVLCPDLHLRLDRQVECLALAFLAFNAPDAVEFVVEGPTSAAAPGDAEDGASSVYHYAERVRMEARNRLYAL